MERSFESHVRAAVFFGRQGKQVKGARERMRAQSERRSAAVEAARLLLARRRTQAGSPGGRWTAGAR